MTQPKTYTRLIAEVAMPDGEVLRSSVETNRWDLNAEEAVEMFRSLMLSMGYAEASVAEVLDPEELTGPAYGECTCDCDACREAHE